MANLCEITEFHALPSKVSKLGFTDSETSAGNLDKHIPWGPKVSLSLRYFSELYYKIYPLKNVLFHACRWV